MDEIDENAYVVEPKNPKRCDKYRRVVLGIHTHIYIYIYAYIYACTDIFLTLGRLHREIYIQT